MYAVPYRFFGTFFKIAGCLFDARENLASHLGPSSSAPFWYVSKPRFSDDWPTCLARFPLDAESLWIIQARDIVNLIWPCLNFTRQIHVNPMRKIHVPRWPQKSVQDNCSPGICSWIDDLLRARSFGWLSRSIPLSESNYSPQLTDMRNATTRAPL